MSQSKLLKDSAKKKPPAAGMGRPKGAINKTTKELKEMILEALSEAGGVSYLVEQARGNPKAFLPLLGKVLPLQITGKGDGPIQISFTQTDADI